MINLSRFLHTATYIYDNYGVAFTIKGLLKYNYAQMITVLSYGLNNSEIFLRKYVKVLDFNVLDFGIVIVNNSG